MGYDIEGLIAALSSAPAIPLVTENGRLRNKSRDYYWYSPVLREALDAVRADVCAMPDDEAGVIRVVAECFARDIPLTVRGSGTGNYGQAMPLEGGCVLDLSSLTRVHWVRPASARVDAGVRLLDLDTAARKETGQEMRMHPSTLRNATIGGFVCGGSGGVGSITWGGLRDRGNVLGLRVLTMEAQPRVIELRGDDVQKAIHAYGTTGIVTEVEIALGPAHEWIDFVVAFDDFGDAVRFAASLAAQDALLKKLVTVIDASIVQRYLKPIGALAGSRSVVLTMIAPVALEGFAAMVRAAGGSVAYRTGDAAPLLPIFEYAWNHTTLHALKFSRDVTYHQTLYPPPDVVERILDVHAKLPADVHDHLEFVRFDGSVAAFGLPLIEMAADVDQRSASKRLDEITQAFESWGCPTFNPHTWSLEEGGMKRVDPAQLAFKRKTDPKGLLNPGKMLAWSDPQYRSDDQRVHLFANR